MDPVAIRFKLPGLPVNLPKLPGPGNKLSKFIVTTAAASIVLTMGSFAAFTGITSTDSFKASHNLSTPNTVPTVGVKVSKSAQTGGGTVVGSGGTSNANSPTVTLSASPNSVVIGGSTHLVWTTTNNPTSCTASDDWSGDVAASGEATPPPLTQVQTYLFTLTCRNASGTGFATVPVGATSQGGSGTIGRPVVTLAVDPSAIFTGDKSTLIWDATNSPSSCTASGDWSGKKVVKGSENTAALSNAKKYTYTLTCYNGSGLGYATATLAVTAPPANIPNVQISTSTLGNLRPGASTAIIWSVSNNPTSCTASGDWSGSKAASGTQPVGPLNTIKTYTFTLTCSNSAGSTFDSVTAQIIPDPPTVSLTASPSTVIVGSVSTLTWSTTGIITSCSATGDWSGIKAASGKQSTGILSIAKRYAYNLSCSNSGGTGFANNIGVTVNQPPAPVVTINVSPLSTTVGNGANITWSATGNPTSCTASGDWSGPKAASGTQNTGALTIEKNYTYNLSCANGGGTSLSSGSISVSASTPTVVKPLVTISVSPTTIGTGSSATLNWIVSNSPTSCTASGGWSGSKSASGSTSTGSVLAAGIQTYTLSCTNSAGTDINSASLTVIATPVISIAMNPGSITVGGSATLSWSVSNSPSSCSAGGSWSGTKAASGSQAVTSATAGTLTYSLSCTNTGGTSSANATLLVNDVVIVYCSGLTPCIGNAELAQHATIGNCWGYNLDWVINITAYAPHHKGGTGTGSLESPSATCAHDLAPILGGGSKIPGYTESGGASTHNHASSTKTNVGSALQSYFTGFYDPTKP